MKQPQVRAQSSVGENVQQASTGRGRGRGGKGGGSLSGAIGQSQPQARVYATQGRRHLPHLILSLVHFLFVVLMLMS